MPVWLSVRSAFVSTVAGWMHRHYEVINEHATRCQKCNGMCAEGQQETQEVPSDADRNTRLSEVLIEITLEEVRRRLR